VIFDIAEYIMMEFTMPNKSLKSNMQDMQEVLILKKRRRVLLVSLPQSSISQKRIAGLKLKK
jgi:hypothetical protein